jgi:hypothetical protein
VSKRFKNSVTSVHSAVKLLINYTQEMRDLRYDAARRGCVDPFDRLIELGDTEALDDRLLLFRVADHAPVILDLDLAAAVCFYFLCHDIA